VTERRAVPGAGVLGVAAGVRERAEAWQAEGAGGDCAVTGDDLAGALAGAPLAMVALRLEVAAGRAGLRAAAPAPGAAAADLVPRRGRGGSLELAVGAPAQVPQRRRAAGCERVAWLGSA
jgi:hypothetical protein